MSLDRPKPFVQSRCPNCDTLYHIDRGTLDEAEGQARCFRCGTVFDALAQQADTMATEPELTRLVKSPEHPEGDHGRESVPVMLAAADDVRPKPAPAETSTATAPVPATPAADTTRESSAEIEPTAQATPETGDAPSPVAPSPAETSPDDLPFDVPDDLPDLQPTETPPGEASAPPRSAARRLLALTGKLVLVLVLLLAGLAQWLWFQPRYLEPVRPYYSGLQSWCARHDCPVRLPALPSVRAIEAFTVLQREIAPAEDRPGELRISMTFVNGAEFAQPYPDVLVTLLDRDGGTVTERRFQPIDYLGDTQARLIGPQEVISFDLLTEDPGDSATGFKLKFL